MSNYLRAGLFDTITITLALLIVLAVPLIGEASLLVTMLTPAVGVVVMLTVIAPEGSFREMISALGLDRIGIKGWPLAAAALAVIHLAGMAILFGLGLALFLPPDMGEAGAAVSAKILLGFLIGTGLALAEELGWRGYLFPRLLALGFLPAALITGFLHGLWHLPLMLSTSYYHGTGNPWIVVPLFLITLTLAGVFYGFLRLWTASIWPVAIAHAAANNAWEMTRDMTETKSPLVLEYLGGESGLVMIGGLLIVNASIILYMKRSR